ncbi:MAG: LysR family transcriptional regulator [Firmicutes bacterium]|nr:LysR family transcriptional regulator [Bacillota bacterium]
MTLTQLKYAVAISESSSMNEAARKLFISQPSLSASIRSLEDELGIKLFNRSSRGIIATPEGEEFIGYARQLTEQYGLIENHYINKEPLQKRFAVSMQHYTFAVEAFIHITREFGLEEYEFSIRETRTAEVIEDVRNFRSELGVLYLNDFNRPILTKIFQENNVVFHDLFDCDIYAYMANTHPLAGEREVSIEQLDEYPCLAFEQGIENSFYLAEEMLSTHHYKQLIRVNDRATILNMMIGLDGYTLCSGIICNELNGSQYTAVRLKESEPMTLGYIVRKDGALSQTALRYIEELSKYESGVI